MMSSVGVHHQPTSQQQQQQIQCENEADSLLCKLTVDEVRQVVARTRAEIASRNDALRSFVGEHHRDLVQVADAVIAVHDVSESVLNALNDAAVNGIKKKKKEEMEQRLSTTQREVLNVSRMMKVVVCAPEKVADLLDADEFLSATLMYFRALRSYSVLSSAKDPVTLCVLNSVPLVERQWKSMATKPDEICHRCWDAVSESKQVGASVADDDSLPGVLSLTHCAASLASILLLKKVQPEVLVREFFDHRTTALLSCGDGEVSDSLCTFVDRFVATFSFANALFCSHCAPQQQQTEALQKSLMSKVVARLDRQRCLPKDVDDFVGDLAQACGIASFIADDVLHGICKGWLAGAVTRIKAMIRSQLAGVKTLTMLRAVAEAIRNRISTHNANSLSESQQSWNVVACTILECEFDLWDSLFCEVFKERSMTIITSHCDALAKLATKLISSVSIEKPLDAKEGNDDSWNMGSTDVKWNSSNIPDIDKLVTLKDGTSVHPMVEAFIAAMEQALSAVYTDVDHLSDFDGSMFFGGAFCGLKKTAGSCLEHLISDIAVSLDGRINESNCDSAFILHCGQIAQAVLQALPSLKRLCDLCGAKPTFVPLARVYGQSLSSWITSSIAQPLAVFREQLSSIQWEEKSTSMMLKSTYEHPPGITENEQLLLPAFLTPCLGTLLWDVSSLMVRSHVSDLPRPAALFLCRELSNGILAAYSNIVESLSKIVGCGKQLEAETAVQLWFDIYAVGELFNSRVAFVDPSDPVMQSVASEMVDKSETAKGEDVLSVLKDDGWPSRISHTLAMVQSLMDPVECGFFKPHIRACVLRCLQRSALVFSVYSSSILPPTGTSTSPYTSPMRGSSPAASPSSSSLSATASMVPCARVAPRFALLPSTSSITVAAAALTAPWTSGIITTPLRASSPATPVSTPQHRRFGSDFFNAFTPSTPLGVSSSLSSSRRTADDDAMLMAMSSIF